MIDRRQFLKTSAAAAALTALDGCTDLAPAGRENPGRVFIADAPDYRRDLVAAIRDGLQQFSDFRVRGKTILLKPNLVETSDSDRPINTHPAVIVAAAEALRRAGAKKVIVGDGPGHRRDVELVLNQSGLGRALREAHLDFVDLNHDAVVPVRNLGGMTKLSSLYLPRTVVAVDAVVSMAKLKTHHWAGATLSMKNCFGLMPGLVYGWPKNVLHWQGIENSIVDIICTVKPNFGIVDGIVGMEGDGPIMGTAKRVGSIVMSDRLASLDATCAAMMGMVPNRLTYVRELARRGFGASGTADIDQAGENLARYQTRFAVLPHFAHLLA